MSEPLILFDGTSSKFEADKIYEMEGRYFFLLERVCYRIDVMHYTLQMPSVRLEQQAALDELRETRNWLSALLHHKVSERKIS